MSKDRATEHESVAWFASCGDFRAEMLVAFYSAVMSCYGGLGASDLEVPQAGFLLRLSGAYCKPARLSLCES